ncbi:hypothetical protein V1509DRAFT_607678 [Lipomyces kononenkoae]
MLRSLRKEVYSPSSQVLDLLRDRLRLTIKNIEKVECIDNWLCDGHIIRSGSGGVGLICDPVPPDDGMDLDQDLDSWIECSFLSDEGEDSILWVFQQLRTVYDRLGLISPVTIPCIHTKQIFKAKALSARPPLARKEITEYVNEQWGEFLKLWYPSVNVKTEESVNEAWAELRTQYESNRPLMAYMSDDE